MTQHGYTLTRIEVVVAPPALYLLSVKDMLNSPIQVSAQNCFTNPSGAFTGEISPNQLKDAGIHWVILGHSERRSLFGDTDILVAEKVKAALGAGLGVIACVGEKLEEREGGKTLEVVERQLEAVAGEIDEASWK
jgi:triosephosphate isomerase